MRLRLALLLTGTLVVGACGGGAATPSPSSSPKPSSTPAASDIFAQSPAPSEAASPAPEVSAAPSTPAVGGKTYTVKKNDTMWAISIKFGVSLSALLAANQTVDPTTMKIGTVLRIPPK